MERELLTKLLTDPAHWPVYLFLAAIILLVVKVISSIADSITANLLKRAKKKKGLQALFKGAFQVAGIALVIYIANATYWTHSMARLIPPPTAKPINSFEAKVEIVIASNDTRKARYMDVGGYLAFYRGSQPLLVASGHESQCAPAGENEYRISSLFKMDLNDSAVGKPVNVLSQAEYIQLEFPKLSNAYKLIRGNAKCVINGEVRIDMSFPPQDAKDQKVYLRNIDGVRQQLRLGD